MELVIILIAKRLQIQAHSTKILLEPARAVTGLGSKGPLKVLNGIKLILDDHGNNLDSFTISFEILQRSPTPQISNWSGTIFSRFLQQTGSSSQSKTE